MTDIKLLTELLDEADKKIGYCSVCNAGRDCDKYDCNECRAEYLTDHGLLRWHSAEEPPTESKEYICYYAPRDVIAVMHYSAKYKLWNAIDEETEAEARNHCLDGITFWMKIPEPPVNGSAISKKGGV